MLNREQIAEAIAEGLDDAAKAYDRVYPCDVNKDMQRTSGKQKNNEQFFSSFIANKIRSKIAEQSADDFVTHETSDFIIESAVRVSKNLEPIGYNNDRYDLVIWSKNHTPYSIIEVKLSDQLFDLKKDSIKIAGILARCGYSAGGTLRNCFIASHIRSNTKAKLSKAAADKLNDHLSMNDLLNHNNGARLELCRKSKSDDKSLIFRLSSSAVKSI